MRGDASGKKTSGLQQKNVEVKPKNKPKTIWNGDGVPMRHLSFLGRKEYS